MSERKLFDLFYEAVYTNTTDPLHPVKTDLYNDDYFKIRWETFTTVEGLRNWLRALPPQFDAHSFADNLSFLEHLISKYGFVAGGTMGTSRDNHESSRLHLGAYIAIGGKVFNAETGAEEEGPVLVDLEKELNISHSIGPKESYDQYAATKGNFGGRLHEASLRDLLDEPASIEPETTEVIDMYTPFSVEILDGEDLPKDEEDLPSVELSDVEKKIMGIKKEIEDLKPEFPEDKNPEVAKALDDITASLEVASHHVDDIQEELPSELDVPEGLEGDEDELPLKEERSAQEIAAAVKQRDNEILEHALKVLILAQHNEEKLKEVASQYIETHNLDVRLYEFLVSCKILQGVYDSMASPVVRTYFKDFGDGSSFISGRPLPRDADGVVRKKNFIDCSFHPGTEAEVEDCLINYRPIPNGKVNFYALTKEA